jgi:phage terminase small subunit
MEKRSKSLGIDANYVLEKIKETIERCSQAEPVRDAEGETGEYKFESNSVLKGCELLGRHLKMFTDKVEVDGSVSLSEAIVASRNRCGK